MCRQVMWIAAALILGNLHFAAAQELVQELNLYSPQPEHKLLERFAGEWQFEKMTAPSDGSPPENAGTGEVHAELLGGFFVVCRWTGKLYDTDYKAVQTLGYDVNRQEYSGTWVDSIMSYRWQFNGSRQRETEDLIVVASGPGPQGGTMQYRERYQFNSADSITIVAEMRQDETWVQFMTTRLTRKKNSGVK